MALKPTDTGLSDPPSQPTADVTPAQAKEVLYRAVPYLGMAKTFDFLHATNEILSGCGVRLSPPGRRPRRSASV